QKRLQRGELERFFPVADMAAIAFAPLIVVAKNTFAPDHEGKPVFEAMAAAGNRGRHMPDHDLMESVLAEDRAFLRNQYGFHVVIPNNSSGCCQSEQRTVRSPALKGCVP